MVAGWLTGIAASIEQIGRCKAGPYWGRSLAASQQS